MTSAAAPTRLVLPSLGDSMTFLRSLGSPFIELGLSFARGAPAAEVEGLRAGVSESPIVVSAFAAQHADGSWGSDDDRRRRVLPTLWMAKTLGELGADDTHPGWHRAVDFLGGLAHTKDGIFGLDGRDAGVLSCYAGIAARLYLQGGRADLARPQIEWIKAYQDVRVSGVTRRRRPAAIWDERLRTRYGGCLADTTCLIGLVKSGEALRAWDAREPDSQAAELVDAIREVYLERRLMYRSNGEIVPIGASGSDPARWLQPTYPLDWHTDLVEVLDLVARTGPADIRMQPAIDRLIEFQLPDGTWPLRQTFRPPDLPVLERRSRTAGSPIITLRVVTAVAAISDGPLD